MTEKTSRGVSDKNHVTEEGTGVFLQNPGSLLEVTKVRREAVEGYYYAYSVEGSERQRDERSVPAASPENKENTEESCHQREHLNVC